MPRRNAIAICELYLGTRDTYEVALSLNKLVRHDVTEVLKIPQALLQRFDCRGSLCILSAGVVLRITGLNIP